MESREDSEFLKRPRNNIVIKKSVNLMKQNFKETELIPRS